MFNVGVHATLNIDNNFASVHPDISKLSFGFMSHNTVTVHTNICYQTSHILVEKIEKF